MRERIELKEKYIEIDKKMVLVLRSGFVQRKKLRRKDGREIKILSN